MEGLIQFFQVEKPYPRLAASSCMAIVRSFKCFMGLLGIAYTAAEYACAVACAKGYSREFGSAGHKTPGAISWEQVQQVGAYVQVRARTTTPNNRLLLLQIADIIKVMFIGGLRIAEVGGLARQ
jgi:hypothetical protein